MNIIKELDKVNKKRCERVFNMPFEKLKLNEFSNMVAAEAGELSGICHKIKMPCYPHNQKANNKELADEIADVFITLHLLATKANIDITEAVVSKFNEVSVKKNSIYTID